MGTQRHVIKRQVVEVTLAKKENAWQLQQALSRIFQQCLPPLLDRCLSEVCSPDYLHRIDRLELDLGILDSNSLETDILERMEVTLRQALGEQIGYAQSLPVAEQTHDPMLAHAELFEHFVLEGYLPWWADVSQRQLPEKSFTVLSISAPDALKRLLPGLIHEPRCLQRLISYFDDSRLIAMTALLTAASEDLTASLVQALSAVHPLLQQRSRTPALSLRATLWQSLLQVAVAGEPAISRRVEFLAAVTARWAKLQGLPETVFVGCLQQLLSDKVMRNNEWLQTIKLLLPIKPTSTVLDEEVVGDSHATASKSVNEVSTVSTDTAINPMFNRDRLASIEMSNRSAIFAKSSSTQLESATASQSTDTADPMDYRQLPVSAAINRYEIFNKPYITQTKSGDKSSIADQARDFVSNPISNRHRLTSTPISNRYTMLKRICESYSVHAQKADDEPLSEQITTKQSAREFVHSSLSNRLSVKNNSSEASASIEATSARSAFSDTDALYINNAGLCILWPFLATFFESLELVQNGRFHNQSAKQCAVSLLHYLATEELNPSEYLLPFNKLLCAMEIEEVFDLEMPLTAEQIEACDELLGAVIGNAPILNNMSVNGFRGSFLLRRGSLSASEGSWLLRVERETYDLVLERFPWSWQWFKLPWMEYPIRVEW
ncbi:contractile injection system tape measure protein [Methylobacter sp.]|uniref:contractile injection system tape measure protein n=1 Tax=Methylobacter sp. TaxID=2051955 RepID=UPI002FDCAF21